MYFRSVNQGRKDNVLYGAGGHTSCLQACIATAFILNFSGNEGHEGRRDLSRRLLGFQHSFPLAQIEQRSLESMADIGRWRSNKSYFDCTMILRHLGKMF